MKAEMNYKPWVNTHPDNLYRILSCFQGDLSGLVFWGFRYFLGRRTYAVSEFTHDLSKAWPYLDEPTKELIERELEDAFERDDELRQGNSGYSPLGDDCDRQSWSEVRAAYKN